MQLGKHSRRWAAPKQGDLTVATAETCRKCKRIFKSARKCVRHEMTCEAEPAEVQQDHPCRICGQSFPDRVTRNTHQLKCNGTIELNTRCRYCGRGLDSDQQRISHEGSCSSKQAQLSDNILLWKSPRCGWKLPNTGQPPKKRQDAQDRHTNQCRGTDLANRTCNKCQKVWDTMTARITHELACKTEEEQRTCRYCQQVFRTKDQRKHHETRHRRDGNIYLFFRN